MKKLHMITAAAGILLALAGPTLAATRAHHRGLDAYASDRSGAYYYGPIGGQNDTQALTPAQHSYTRSPYQGQNLPYPDRPYGDPDSW
jgi:hypothetical protein